MPSDAVPTLSWKSQKRILETLSVSRTAVQVAPERIDKGVRVRTRDHNNRFAADNVTCARDAARKTYVTAADNV